jgi:hypothetical protein
LPVCLIASACDGDFYWDKDVDGLDLTMIASDFGQTDCGGLCIGDFNGDTNVDVSDLKSFSANFGSIGCQGPNPNGIPLPGNDGANAIDATRYFPPIGAEETDVVNRFLTTRLLAVIDPDATVAEVNAVLEQFDARIVGMTAGNGIVTLRIPRVATEAQAESLATQITKGEAFLFAFPAYTVGVEPYDAGTTETVKASLPESGAKSIQHLIVLKMPAAWNAVGLALKNKNPITVLVPDQYANNTPHPEIPSQTFFDGSGLSFPHKENNTYATANHGFMASGILGASFDQTPVTGTSPDPARLLRIISVRLGGLSWREVHQEIARSLPASPEKVVLSTSLGYPAELEGLGGIGWKERALLALHWRSLIYFRAYRIFHATAAGNEGKYEGDVGEARFGSSFSSAHFFGPVSDMLEGKDISDEEREMFAEHTRDTLERRPGADSALPNVLVVGSSYRSGLENPTSSRGSEVRTVGSKILAPCALADQVCDGNVAFYTHGGSSLSAPQVAGLSAYLWNLKPSASPEELIRIIKHAYDMSETPGLVDAYMAVLALDQGQSLVVRQDILDVAGATPTPGTNGKFDENDVELYLSKFKAHEEQRAGGAIDPDYSRFDLNGDGYTGGDNLVYATKFDLTADPVPEFTVFTRDIDGLAFEFNEDVLTDCEVLLFYAYSPLYQGNPDKRQELKVKCGPTNVVCDFEATVQGHWKYALTDGSYETYYDDDASAAAYVLNGSFVGNTYSATWNEPGVLGSIEEGTITIVLNDDRDRVVNIELHWTWTLPDRVHRSNFVGKNIPRYLDNYYEVDGTDTCNHIDTLEYSLEFEGAAHTLESYDCNADNKMYVYFEFN